MARLKIGDSIEVIHNGKKTNQIETIVDIIEDYGGNSYWLRDEKGRLTLESDTSTTIFKKLN